MAKRREIPSENPLLRERVGAIVGDVTPPPLAHEAEFTPKEQVASTSIPSPKRQPARRRKQGREDVHAKTRLTREEADAIERFTRTLSAHLRTKVNGSEVTRALWTIALRAEERLAQLSHKAPALERPCYGDQLAMAEFEDAIVEFLQRVLR